MDADGIDILSDVEPPQHPDLMALLKSSSSNDSIMPKQYEVSVDHVSMAQTASGLCQHSSKSMELVGFSSLEHLDGPQLLLSSKILGIRDPHSLMVKKDLSMSKPQVSRVFRNFEMQDPDMEDLKDKETKDLDSLKMG